MLQGASSGGGAGAGAGSTTTQEVEVDIDELLDMDGDELRRTHLTVRSSLILWGSPSSTRLTSLHTP